MGENFSKMITFVLQLFGSQTPEAAPVRRPAVNWKSILAYSPYYEAVRCFEREFALRVRGEKLATPDTERLLRTMDAGVRQCFVHFLMRQLEECRGDRKRRLMLRHLLHRVTGYAI